MRKSLLIVLAAAAVSAASVPAVASGGHGSAPANYENDSARYLLSRMRSSRGARVEVLSQPYRVKVDVRGRRDVAAWAVDARVRAPGNGASTRVQRFTVVFVNGRPIALRRDVRRLNVV
ncbi:MAG: hypothetical protein AAGC56_12760 [Pseudomonadota bacterium]